MAFVFTNKRAPSAFDELTPLQQKQLSICGKRYDGKAQPAARRYEQFAREHLERWDAVDGKDHLYDAWFYMVDSGTIFEAGTTKVAAEMIQFELKSKDPLLALLLGEALKRKKK